jgi:hypothetical protein
MQTGHRLADVANTQKNARRLIFWCATDNLGWSRRDATHAANMLIIDEPYALEYYVFTISMG